MSEPTRPKYLVLPGRMPSRNDRQRHYIGAGELIRLYGVDPRECLIVNDRRRLLGLDTSEFIVLRPRYDGRYEIPQQSREATP